jgi:hypothetical protein
MREAEKQFSHALQNQVGEEDLWVAGGVRVV